MIRQAQQREYDRQRQEKMKPAYNALMKVYPFSTSDEQGEVWLPITGDYHVSTLGRIKSFKNKTPRILKPVLTNGYLCIRLYINGKQKNIGVHILVARAFIANPENKPEVNHDDGHPMNCTVGNLYWATHAENVQHSYDTGLKVSAQGTEVYNAKFTNEQILYIRENPESLTTYQLAEKFGTTPGIISNIQRGKSYVNAGGTVREKIERRIPDEIRAAIRADRATGLYTKTALARKYGYSRSTIRDIINEG